MQDLSAQIERISQKMMQVVQRLEAAMQANAALTEENKQLKEQNQVLENKLAEYAQAVGSTQMQIKDERAGEAMEVKAISIELDHYIQEIDKCIEWLKSA